MSNRASLLALVLMVGLLTVGAAALDVLPAGASVTSVQAAPAKGLVTAAEAARLGFTRPVGKPVSSKKTGVPGCTAGAQAEFENAKRTTGLVSEVLVCKSAAVSAGLIAKAKKAAGRSPGAKPPKALGSTAFERSAGGSTYAISWQRGRLLELVAIDANVPASSGTAPTSATATPLTAKLQQSLTKAALQQDATTQ